MSAETQGYSRDLLKQDTERVKTKEELAREKTADGKKLIETEEGKKTLAMKWIDKAKLGEAGKKAVLAEIGVNENTPAKEFVEKVAAWQEQNGLAKPGEGDGVLGWKTLEAVDNKISEKFDIDQDANDGQGSSSGGRLADIDTDEKETIALREKEEARKEKLGDLKKRAESTDTADHEGDIRDPEGKSLIYDADKKQWVGNESDTSGKIFNTETGKYETLKERELLKTEQLLTSIKGAAEAGDSRDYIDGYVKELPSDSLSTEQLKDLNNTLNPKGYNVVDTTPGYALEDYDYQGKQVNQLLTSIKGAAEAGDSRDYIDGYVKELPSDSLSTEQLKDLNNTLNPKGYNVVDTTPGYALEDYKSIEDRFAELKQSDPLIALNEDFGGYKADTTGFNNDLTNVLLSDITTELDWWDDTAENVPLKRKLAEASAQAQEFVKNNPSLGNITLSEYTEIKKNPDAFLLGERAIDRFFGQKRALLVSKVSGNGSEYKKVGSLWTKKEGDKISIASGDKFISFEEYATKNIIDPVTKPTQVPGSTTLFYTVEYNRGKKEITVGTKAEDGSINRDKARYYVDNVWRDSPNSDVG